MIEINLILPHRILEFWESCKPYIEKSFSLHPYPINIEEILKSLLDRQTQLWIVHRGNLDIIGAFTTSITEYHGNRIGTIEYLGGEDFDLWATKMLTMMESWAKEYEVKYLQSPGRKGWGKYTKPLGYSSDIVIFKKEI